MWNFPCILALHRNKAREETRWLAPYIPKILGDPKPGSSNSSRIEVSNTEKETIGPPFVRLIDLNDQRSIL